MGETKEMSWRDNLRTNSYGESSADMRMADLARRLTVEGGLPSAPKTRQTIVLKQTIPDQTYDDERTVFYEDGDIVHKHPDVDREIDDELVHRRWFVIRLQYSAPQSKRSEEQMLQVLQQVLWWRSKQGFEERRGGRIAQYGFDVEYENVEPETEDAVKRILESGT
jgi:hypothetical protein